MDARREAAGCREGHTSQAVVTVYWHTMTLEQQRAAVRSRARVRSFRQPPWCMYPDAVAGVMGCWSLMLGHVRSRADCKTCDLEIGNVRKERKRGVSFVDHYTRES